VLIGARSKGKLAAVSNVHLMLGGSSGGTFSLYFVDNIKTTQNLAKDNVPTIEPASLDSTDKELGTVSVRTSVRHGEHTRAGVLELEVLIGELSAVDRLSATAIAVGEIAALDHEAGDDAVEDATLVVERLAGRSLPLLARAKRPEILHCLRGGFAVQSDHHAARGLVVDLDVEVNLVCYLV